MTTDGDVIVRTRGLTRRFGDLAAVDRVDLEVRRGEVFGLLGPDGAGKTTLLRLLCALLDPDEGEAYIAGRAVARESERVRDIVGYMAQRPGLYDDLTVEENMAFYADLFGLARSQWRSRAERLLAITRMAEFRRRPAGRLSGGMRQKLALMCVLLHRPELLLLDEPTRGVDPVSRRDFWSILYGLTSEGVTVLVSTSYLDEAERCSRVGLMHKGRLVWCDTPDVIRAWPREQCYRLVCDDRLRAREILAEAPGVASVEPFGHALHLFLDRRKASAETLSHQLEAAGIRSVTIQPIEPSLEDVFILLIRKGAWER